MTKPTYLEIRNQLKSGDVALFSSHNGFGDKLIKLGTFSQFSHIGSVFELAGRFFLLEASFAGGVRMVPLSLRVPDYIFRLSSLHPWNDQAEELAMSHQMEKYSTIEAIRAWLGDKEGKGWICTKFVQDIAEAQGYKFPASHQVPQVFFDQMMQEKVPFIWLDVKASLDQLKAKKKSSPLTIRK